MASIRKKAGCKNWFACFTMPDGRRVQRSTKLATRKAAQQRADEWEKLSLERATARQAHRVIADIYRTAHKENLPFSSTHDYLANWVERRRQEVAPATHAAYKHRVKHFLAYLGDRAKDSMGEVSAADLLCYRDHEASRVSPRSVNIGIKILHAAFAEAKRDSVIPENPVKDVQALRYQGGTRRRPFSLQEIKDIIAVANDEWRSLILFGVYTGQRLGDIARLNWQNVDLGCKEIHVRMVKTGRVVRIPICKPLADHIATLPTSDNPAEPLHPRAHAAVASKGRTGTLSNQFGDLLVAAGLASEKTHDKKRQGRDARRASSELSFHSLRHTATSLLKNAGVSPAIVQDIIGHNSVEVSALYTHIDSAAKRRALAKMPDLREKKSRKGV